MIGGSYPPPPILVDTNDLYLLTTGQFDSIVCGSWIVLSSGCVVARSSWGLERGREEGGGGGEEGGKGGREREREREREGGKGGREREREGRREGGRGKGRWREGREEGGKREGGG